MPEWLDTAYGFVVLWLAGLYALFGWVEKLAPKFEKIWKWLGLETKGMRARREMADEIENGKQRMERIEKNSDRNVALFLAHEKEVVGKFTGIRDELIEEIAKLHIKLDEQNEKIDQNYEATRKTDRALLRDRINGGMRYFTQNKDEKGDVHIVETDYENMYDLFEEYFANGGNGPFEQMYKDEFLHFIRER